MTVAADFTIDRARTTASVQTLDASRLLVRLALRFAGMSFALVAVFIWLAPGASWESDVMLFKLVLFAVAVLLALGCWQASVPPLPPTVEIDVARGELRLVREHAVASQRVLKRCAFEDLQIVELKGWNISFWERGGHLLAEITLSNATSHAVLLHALRQAGKLE